MREGVDAVWKQLEGRARTNVRRAEEAGVTVRESKSAADWGAFYELHQITYQRLGVPSYPATLFRTIFERLIPGELCCVHFADLNGQLVAAQNTAYYKQGAYYWHGFTTDAGLKANAMTLLWWKSIKTLLERDKIQWLDCGDAVLNVGEGKMRHLSDFKKGFGGDLYPAFRGQFNGTNKLYNRFVHLKGLISGQ